METLVRIDDEDDDDDDADDGFNFFLFLRRNESFR